MTKREEHGAQGHQDTSKIVQRAWTALPPDHRDLLTEVGAAQWTVVDEVLGSSVHKLLRSSGHRGLSEQSRVRTDAAIAVWVPHLRIVVFNTRHPALTGLSPRAFSRFIARTAWHEWGHALSIARCTAEDVASGARLLKLAPTGVSDRVRLAGYRRREYTYELIAETYALLVRRRTQGKRGRPQWLSQEVYELVRRVTEWPD